MTDQQPASKRKGLSPRGDSQRKGPGLCVIDGSPVTLYWRPKDSRSGAGLNGVSVNVPPTSLQIGEITAIKTHLDQQTTIDIKSPACQISTSLSGQTRTIGKFIPEEKKYINEFWMSSAGHWDGGDWPTRHKAEIDRRSLLPEDLHEKFRLASTCSFAPSGCNADCGR